MTLAEFDNEIRTRFPIIAGVDEAGRGPLAGDVYAAAVILPSDLIIEEKNSLCSSTLLAAVLGRMLFFLTKE